MSEQWVAAQSWLVVVGDDHRPLRVVAEVKPGPDAGKHAVLFSAAPELLASLSEIVEEWGCPNTPKWHRAKAAISKATGR